jgi:pilus assembly protein TadC
MAGFAAGITLGLLAAANGLPILLLALPLSLSLGGFFLPRWELQSDLKQRAESIFFEVPYMLDRLSVNLAARKGDLVDSLNATLMRPEGGYLVRELLQVVEDNAKAGHIEKALERMARRNRDIPIVVRLSELLANSQHGAVDLGQALQTIGDRASEEVENRIRRRGEENSQAMIVPSMIALIGIMLVMLGPAFIDLGTLIR